MISICIPIYNYDVTKLVKTLALQSVSLEVPSEIIFIDDASDNLFKKINSSVCKNETYIQLKQNIGRAAIRNKFLKFASYDNLLFLDCDSIIISINFLSNYINTIKLNPNKVIYGGRNYPNIPPNRKKLLRWKYGRLKESKHFKIRNKNPNKSFITCNFVIPIHILKTIKFDERLKNYGHEDTLFGYKLKKLDISIVHIDNAILNGYLDDNLTYINKTEAAIYNLKRILKFVNYDNVFIQEVSLLKIYYKYKKSMLLVALLFILFKPFIKYLLSKGYVNLSIFNFYKLGFLAVIMNTKKVA